MGEPECIADAYPYDAGKLITKGVTLSGQLFRQTTCEIMYGPLNCDFILQADNECASLTYPPRIGTLLFQSFPLFNLWKYCKAQPQGTEHVVRSRTRSTDRTFKT